MLRHYTCRFLFYILIILSLFLDSYGNNSLIVNVLCTFLIRYAAVNLTLIPHSSITYLSLKFSPIPLHNREVNIKNIWLATTNNIGCYNCLRASCCFLCLSPNIFSVWHTVPLLYIHIMLSRACSRKALYECKASLRLGKYIRGFICFCQSPPIYSDNLP